MFTGSEPGVRTPGVAFDDQVVERLAVKEIRNADPALADAPIIVVSHNGVVLLMGTVPREDLRADAEHALQRLSRVRRVHNEITVGEPPSVAVRTKDSWITGQVKVGMAGSAEVDANRINVTTYRSVVYLMGRVPRTQADGAVDATRGVRGIEKIVKVFEYVN